MSDTEWRWADPQGQQRLVRTDELRAALASGLVAPNTPVWRPGWKEWKPAHDVPELTTSALSAANGVVPNIPPPPLAVVAVQAAFEATGSHLIPPDSSPRSSEEPPPPPRYVPAPTRPQPGMFHTPSHPMRAPQIPPAPDSKAKAVPAAPDSKPKAVPQAPPSQKTLQKQKQAEIHAGLDELRKSDVDPPTVRPSGDDIHTRETKEKIEARSPKPPAAVPKPMGGMSQLVRPSSTPPPPRTTSKPPPPVKASKPPPPKPKAQNIEELSGSILLPDASGSQRTDAIEELSGSILLPDASGAQKAQAGEELSGSFLLDAGSTGALPSMDSDSAIRTTSTYQPAPAPFAAPPPAAGEPAPRPSTASSEAIAPFAMALGPASVPPPAPFGGSTSREFAAKMPAPAELERETVPAGERVAQPHAAETLVGVPPPPDLIVQSADSPIHPGPSPDVVPVQPPPTSRTPIPPSPPSQPRLSSGTGPGDVPPPERSSVKVHDFRALSPDPRMKFILPALGLLGTLVMIGVIGLIVGLFRKKPSEEPTPSEAATASEAHGAATAQTTTAAATTAATAASPATKPAPLPAGPTIGGACALAGAAHVIAPRAVVASGVEVQPLGARLAIGFASGPRNGIAVSLDPSSLAASQTARVKAPDAIRRLVPVPAARGLAAAADVDRDGDALAGRRTVSADPPFDLGLGAGGLAWAPYKSREASVIWTLDGDAPADALRAAPLDPSNKDAGWAIAFRRGASIFAGAVAGGPTLTPKGPLVKIDGLGAQVGSPTVAAQDGAVLVAWADRASTSDPWGLRWMRFAPGDASADAKPFAMPEGGLGDHAMSPALAPAGQGRFVIAWTEGPTTNHQVRAQTISGAGVAIGAPITVSEAGLFAGQEQVAMLPDGRGVIAYLASNTGDPKAAYAVIATPIACP